MIHIPAATRRATGADTEAHKRLTGDAKTLMRPLVLATSLPLLFACTNAPLDQSRVVAAERQRADAIARNDTSRYSQLVSPDLLMVDRTGELLSKKDRVDAVDSGHARGTRRVEDDVEVRIYGDLALVIGRSLSQEKGTQHSDYFTRIWVQSGGRLEMVGAHYTDITAQVEDDDPSSPKAPDRAIPVLPIATTAPVPDADAGLRHAIRDQHEAYWSKDTDRYRQYVGTDLMRVAENGIRTADELVTGMRANARLPGPPSQQLDIRTRVFGNMAVATWLDQGTDVIGRFAQNRFTVVFARRSDGWQMVHIQSTGLKHG